MARLVVWNIVTLDGRFEGEEPWDLAFHESVWSDDLEAFSDRQTASVGALLFGRKTYEGMAAYWATASGRTADFMNGARKYVASRTLASADWANSELLGDDAVTAVRRLKSGMEKDLYIFGSADLCATLFGAGLIDELRLCIAPVVLGAGRRFFLPGAGPARLRHEETLPLRSGAVILRYGIGRDGATAAG